MLLGHPGRLRLLSRAGLLALVASPLSCERALEADRHNLGGAERQIVGMADPYPADAGLRAQDEALRGSMSARRALAWSVVHKFVDPVALNAAEIDLLEQEQPDAPATLPRFLTWYQKDEFRRMFKQLYQSHGKDNRIAKEPLSEALLVGDAAAGQKGIFEWNANYLAEKGLPEELYTNRIAQLETEADLHGLAGAEAIAYSPALLMHFYQSYADVLRCLSPVKAGSSASMLDLVALDDPPPADDNFTLCFARELPADAAIAKAFWSNDVAHPTMPTFDTSAAALAARLASGDGSWGVTGDGKANPDQDEIVSLRLADDTTYRLGGLHIVTKELRHWLWITLWYSPEPDGDFGADRPDSLGEMDPAWRNYKMCVVTAFEEGDADPRGGYPTAADLAAARQQAGLAEGDPPTPELARMENLVSLGDALAATYRGLGGPTWCSNPYLEEGAFNARSNCIGCHQHAGTPIDAASVLSDATQYPHHGTTLVRKNHPSDYIWAFDKEARLGRIIQAEAKTLDQKDAK
jgi:hypothetical protein